MVVGGFMQEVVNVWIFVFQYVDRFDVEVFANPFNILAKEVSYVDTEIEAGVLIIGMNWKAQYLVFL